MIFKIGKLIGKNWYFIKIYIGSLLQWCGLPKASLQSISTSVLHILIKMPSNNYSLDTKFSKLGFQSHVSHCDPKTKEVCVS